jgi:hypothetical protein
MNLAKNREARLLLTRCRELWNEFDPIGVMADGDGPRDEYDSYLAQTVEHAMSDTNGLKAYVRKVVLEYMGLTGFPEEET